MVEVLVAMAIIGIVAAAFLLALSSASKALILADVRTISESLARSQLEAVKNATYTSHESVAAGTQLYPVINIGADVTNPDSYQIDVEITPYILDEETSNLTLDPSRTGDDGLQLIVVSIYHDENGDGNFDEDERVLSLENYKSARGTA